MPFEPLDLKSLNEQGKFVSDGTSSTKTLNLYAVWGVHNETNRVYVYKQIEGPGEPDRDFEFTVTSGSGNDTASQHVLSGVQDAIDTSSDTIASFSSASATVDGGKGIVSDGVTFVFDIDGFNNAGIYRYKITENALTNSTGDQAELAALGYTRKDAYSSDRYLDVYVGNGANDTLQITGYVMFHDTSNNGNASFDASDTSTTEKKTDGYDGQDSSKSEGDANYDEGDMADHYYSTNFTLSKTITGNFADKTHKFPFAINVSSVLGKGETFTVRTTDCTKVNINAAEGATSKTMVLDVPFGAQEVSVLISDGGSVTLYGLPADATVLVTETNDTSDTYKVSFDNPSTDANAIQSDVAKNGTKAFSNAYALTSYGKTNPNYTVAPTAGDFVASNAITFTNSRLTAMQIMRISMSRIRRKRLV